MQPEQLHPEVTRKAREIDIVSDRLRGDDPVRGYLMDAAFLLREAATAINELNRPASRLLHVVGRSAQREVLSTGVAPWGAAEIIDLGAGATGAAQAVDPSFEQLLVTAFGPRGLWPLFLRLKQPDEVRVQLEFVAGAAVAKATKPAAKGARRYAGAAGGSVRLLAIYSEIDLRLHFEPDQEAPGALDDAAGAGWKLISVRSAEPGGDEARFNRWLDLSAMTQYDRLLGRASTRLVEPLHVSYDTQFMDDELDQPVQPVRIQQGPHQQQSPVTTEAHS